jgi:hypothetical protein
MEKKIMFYDDPRCVQLAPKIFHFKNILPKEIMDGVHADVNAWKRGGPENIWSSNDWYKDKFCPPFVSTFEAWKFMSDLMYPEMLIHPLTNLMVAQPHDEGMFVHCDSPGPGNHDDLYEIDTWSVCCALQYGVIAYFGDFTGGELYYPHINPDGTIKEETRGWEITEERLAEPCLVVAPQPGDIVFHSANRPYDHGTKKVTSGTRYAFSNFSLNAEDNAGSFYSYKSPEWQEQIGQYNPPTLDQLNEWHRPLKLNPTFADVIVEKNEIMRERMSNFKADE